MKNKKQKKNSINKLTRSYKVVVSSEDTFEERLSFSTNKFNVFLVLSLYSIILIAFTISVVFFTQIREMVPGYSSSDLLTQAIYLTKKTDSLENELELNNTFYKSIENVLSGKTEQIIYKDTLALSNEKDNIDFQAVLTNAEDSILRKYVEEEDKFNLTKNELVIENKMFVSPVKGQITQKFDPLNNHFALDILVDTGTPVKSILEGKVIFSEWSVDTGHVLIIDHGDDIISVYKHNSKVLKTQNNFVKAGEVIAYSGNQGTLSTGPHLHFELWKNGTPINPEPLFNFN
ncbi:MAG: M23 family metallopeptidase [Flavobacteriaceae bacterium]|nr:M23 family metallopeptidase [Flavobacteriaceae bacterium]